MGLLTVHASTKFLILVFVFLKYVFFVFVLDAIFCGTNLFFFQDTVWLVESSWCVHYCSIHQFYWVSGRCRSGFALWWFSVWEKLSHKLVVSTSVWSRLLKVSSVFTSLKYTATFFGLLMRCGFVDSSWEYYVFDFGLCVSEICLFCGCSWCDLSWYKFIHFSGHCVASWVILMR